MPFCSQPEAFVAVWNYMQKGDDRAARDVFDRLIAPINKIAAQGNGIFYHVHKTLLRHRGGVLSTPKVRSPAPPVDALTEQELRTLLNELYPNSNQP